MDKLEVFEEKKFWGKIKKLLKLIVSGSVSAGKEVLKRALMLYYCLLDPDTPEWAKAVITGALLYFINPIDGIPDPIPGVGYVDDAAVLLAAIITVSAHIKDEHKLKATNQIKIWFENA